MGKLIIMELDGLKQLVEASEDRLNGVIYVELQTFERNRRVLKLFITPRFKNKCKKGRVWKSKQMLTALKNAEYGFDEVRSHSPGGNDGIFVLSRDYKPKNEIMKKVFDQFIDKKHSGAEEISRELNLPLATLIPVRLVSHHMRLLGLLARGDILDQLVLVDYDDAK